MKYLLSAFVFIFMSFSANAVMLSKDNFKCGNVKVKIEKYNNEDAFYDEEYNRIVLSQHYFKTISPNLQKFIFLHECGHAHKIFSESGADKYAYKEARKINLPIEIKEMCREMESKSRCAKLKKLINSDNSATASK